MLSREELLKTTEYWFENMQNELFRQLSAYMEDNDITRAKLAEQMGVSKGYISQILNGEFNCSLRKLIELSLFINKVPLIDFKPIDTFILESNRSINIPYPKVEPADFSKVNNSTTQSSSCGTVCIEFKPIVVINQEVA